MVLYVRTKRTMSPVYVRVLGYSFTRWYCTFGCVGLLFSIYHCRFRAISLAKAAELSWYRLFGCVGLLLSFYLYRFRSLFISNSSRTVVILNLRLFTGLQFFTLPQPVPLAFSIEGHRTVVVSILRDFLRLGGFFYFLLNIQLQNRGIVKRTPSRSFSNILPPFPPACSSRRPPNRGATVFLPGLSADVFSSFFYFSYPADRLYKCFLLPGSFSAHDTCFRFPAFVEVFPEVSFGPPSFGIPVLPRLA